MFIFCLIYVHVNSLYFHLVFDFCSHDVSSYSHGTLIYVHMLISLLTCQFAILFSGNQLKWWPEAAC